MSETSRLRFGGYRTSHLFEKSLRSTHRYGRITDKRVELVEGITDKVKDARVRGRIFLMRQLWRQKYMINESPQLGFCHGRRHLQSRRRQRVHASLDRVRERRAGAERVKRQRDCRTMSGKTESEVLKQVAFALQTRAISHDNVRVPLPALVLNNFSIYWCDGLVPRLDIVVDIIMLIVKKQSE
jgi:hypothetical protein